MWLFQTEFLPLYDKIVPNFFVYLHFIRYFHRIIYKHLCIFHAKRHRTSRCLFNSCLFPYPCISITQYFSFMARRQEFEARSILNVCEYRKFAANTAMGEKDKLLLDNSRPTRSELYSSYLAAKPVPEGHIKRLLYDLCNNAGSYCSSAFSDSESKSFFDCDWCNQLYFHYDVISWHAHLCSFW